MYPYTLYFKVVDCHNDPEHRITVRPVEIRKYTDGISSQAFHHQVLKAGSKALDKLKSYTVYRHLPTIQHDAEHEWHMDTYIYKGDVIGLEEFYQEIGWDRKRKKMNGRTLWQHILHHFEENEDEH